MLFLMGNSIGKAFSFTFLGYLQLFKKEVYLPLSYEGHSSLLCCCFSSYGSQMTLPPPSKSNPYVSKYISISICIYGE